MAPTQSTYLYTGEGTPDTTGWPVSGFGTVPTQPGEASKPLYYSTLDTPNADPFTTAGAGAPGWELYTGPAQPIAGSPLSTEQQTAPTPSSEQSPTTPVEQSPGGSPIEPSTASVSSQPDIQPTPTSDQGSGSELSSEAPTPSAEQPAATPVAPEQPPAPTLFLLAASAVDHGPWESVAKFAELRVPANAPEHALAALYTVEGDQVPAELEEYTGPTEPLPADDASAEPLPVSPVPAAVIEGIVYRGRNDDDVLTGTFCRVIAGEFQGRYGVFTNTATITLDGWPATVIVRTRDDRDENITVNYADIRPAQAGGR